MTRLLFILIGLWALAVAYEAWGQGRHNPDDPAHWYDASCCNEKDCQPWPRDLVKYGPDGYEIYTTNGSRIWVFPYDSDKLRPSHDGDFHPCFAWFGDPTPEQRVKDGTPIAAFCLYTPQAGA